MEGDYKKVEDDEGKDQTYCVKTLSFLWGLVGFVANIAILFGMAYYILEYQDASNLCWPVWKDTDSKVLMAAACPRCAMIYYPTDDSWSLTWWGMWFFTPTLDIAANARFYTRVTDHQMDCPRSAEPYLNAGPLIVIMLLMMIQDFLYYARLIQYVIRGKFGHAGKFSSYYVFRHFLVFFLVFVYRILYPYVIHGCHNVVLVFIALSILGGSWQSIKESARALREVPVDEDELDWKIAFGTFTLWFSYAASAVQMPFSTYPELSEFAPYAIVIYFFIIVFVSQLSWDGQTNYFVVAGNVLLIEQLLDIGIANVCLLESLRHKTALWRWIWMRVTGGQVSQGGSKTAGTAAANFADDCRQKLYLFKDTYWGEERDGKDYGPQGTDGYSNQMEDFEKAVNIENPQWSVKGVQRPVVTRIQRLVVPNTHAWLTARNAYTSCLFGEHVQDMDARDPKMILANMWGIFVIAIPSLKFRYPLSGLGKQPFLNDPCYGGCAWFTYEDVPAWRIGPCGTLSLLGTVPNSYRSQIEAAPMRVAFKLIWGLCLIVAAFLWATRVNVRDSPIVFCLLPFL